jgi:YidC/Oxa1 family membrane protein insertase
MEQRLLLAFILMGAVIFITPYLLPKPEPQQQKKAEAKKEAPAPATPAAAAPAAAAPGAPAPATPGAKPVPVAAAPEKVEGAQAEYPVFENDLVYVKFANQGATVLAWVLKNFKDTDGKPLNLVNAENITLLGARPFAYEFRQQKPAADLNQKLFAVSKDKDQIVFTFNDGVTSARKSFKFLPGRYLSEIESTVSSNGAPLTHGLSWRGGFGDATVPKAYAAQYTVYLPPADSSPTTNDSSKGKDGPVVEAGNWIFAGLQDAYFAAVVLPKPGETIEMTTFTDTLPYPPNTSDRMPFVGAALAMPGKNQFSMYIGPKDMDLLKKNDPRLESLVDWGWFGWIGRPLFAGLHWINDNYINNWGWSIVVLTVLINMAMIPLKLTSMKSMKKMQALQPQIQAINDKYKGVSFNDPRKQEQNAEVMALYKVHGVNPAGGCVPMLLQFPFFIGFYKVLSVATELRGAPWYWVKDLSQPETLPIRALPILMIVSQFYMQKLTPSSPGMDPAQQKMMMFMPLMMGFFFYNVSSGLVLYWLTGNLVGIAQQLAFNRFMPASPVVVPEKKKKGK